MHNSIRYALLAGAVVSAGVGVAAAAIQATAPAARQPISAHRSTGPAQHQVRRRTGGRFFAEYDLNKDGKITRDEFNKAVAQQFAEAANGAKTLNEQQYAAFRTRSLHQHSDQSFRRADWNGDGRLSFDEFANPIRASFEHADRRSAGAIFCRPAASNGGAKPPSGKSRGPGSRGPRGAGNFCARDDLNHDGKVTRAELDKALAQQFASAAKGASGITHDQFLAMQSIRAHDTSGRTFQRLDRNHDGKLALDEFAASQQRTFVRMDRNSDGVITTDELGSSRRTYYANRGQTRN
jgi:Ca2+-binding EF-hand superfamily protein